jgi:hypothetical protein
MRSSPSFSLFSDAPSALFERRHLTAERIDLRIKELDLRDSPTRPTLQRQVSRLQFFAPHPWRSRYEQASAQQVPV